MSRVVVVVALGLAACSGNQRKPDGAVDAAPALVGRWESPCFGVANEDGTDGYARLSYALTSATWSRESSAFADDACAAELGFVHEDGVWTVEKAPSTLPGVFELRFDLRGRWVTPHVDGYVAFLQSMDCGKAPYVVDTPQDIFAAGCPNLGLEPITACSSEYDLVFVNGGILQVGLRSKDKNLCAPDRRPTSLGAPVLQKSTTPPSKPWGKQAHASADRP